MRSPEADGGDPRIDGGGGLECRAGEVLHPTLQPLSPRATRAVLERLGHRPRRKLGQNFLVDGNTVRRSLALAELKPGEAVVEIGPGLGTLTGALLAAQARVHAVELDRVLASHLRERFRVEIGCGALELLEGDAVESPLGTFRRPPGGPEEFLVVANLPYAISSVWLDAVLAGGVLPRAMVLMLQKEAADRYLATPGQKSFGAISIFLQAAYLPQATHKVSRRCFHPEPGVDSVLLHLCRRPDPVPFSVPLRAAIRSLFTQRRKQVGALCRAIPLLGGWPAKLEASGIPGTTRAEDIPLPHWLALAQEEAHKG